MRRGRIVAVGPADTMLGLGLLGIEGTTVTSAREASDAFDRALTAPGVAMVLLSQAWSEALRERVERASLAEDGPLVVEIPDPHGEARGIPLSERVEQVLGVRLER